mmetsp:Transcript_40522/g.101991  ORF Transcript_40522/g.101991 Transcript_40522/m.101991 type:complete len:283 (+) Transcript_40522:1323-2171(+)
MLSALREELPVRLRVLRGWRFPAPTLEEADAVAEDDPDLDFWLLLELPREFCPVGLRRSDRPPVRRPPCCCWPCCECRFPESCCCTPVLDGTSSGCCHGVYSALRPGYTEGARGHTPGAPANMGAPGKPCGIKKGATFGFIAPGVLCLLCWTRVAMFSDLRRAPIFALPSHFCVRTNRRAERASSSLSKEMNQQSPISERTEDGVGRSSALKRFKTAFSSALEGMLRRITVVCVAVSFVANGRTLLPSGENCRLGESWRACFTSSRGDSLSVVRPKDRSALL